MNGCAAFIAFWLCVVVQVVLKGSLSKAHKT